MVVIWMLHQPFFFQNFIYMTFIQNIFWKKQSCWWLISVYTASYFVLHTHSTLHSFVPGSDSWICNMDKIFNLRPARCKTNNPKITINKIRHAGNNRLCNREKALAVAFLTNWKSRTLHIRSHTAYDTSTSEIGIACFPLMLNSGKVACAAQFYSTIIGTRRLKNYPA